MPGRVQRAAEPSKAPRGKAKLRSAFARKELRNAIKQMNIEELERKHKQGYEHQPVGKAEFSVWEAEQEWGSKK